MFAFISEILGVIAKKPEKPSIIPYLSRKEKNFKMECFISKWNVIIPLFGSKYFRSIDY